MKAVIKNFCRGIRTVKCNECVLAVEGINSRAKAASLVGRRVEIKFRKKSISGKIVSAHGSKGALKARFSRGIPGQAIGSAVKIAD